MSLILSLVHTFRSVASRNTHNLQFFNLIRLLSSDNSENSNPQAYKIRRIMPLDQRYVTAYHLFLQEKTRSKEKVQGLKEYARMWRELPDSVKQEYHDKAQKSNESNNAIFIDERRPSYRGLGKKKSKTEHPDKLVTIENGEKSDIVEKSTLNENPSKSGEEKPKSGRLQIDKKLEKNTSSSSRPKTKPELQLESVPEKLSSELPPIVPYLVFKERIAPIMPNSIENARILLSLWTNLNKKKKKEYEQMAKAMTEERRKKYKKILEGMAEEAEKHYYGTRTAGNQDESSPARNSNWTKGPYKEQMEKLVDDAKQCPDKDIKEFQNRKDELFPVLAPFELELQKKFQNMIVDEENINSHKCSSGKKYNSEASDASTTIQDEQEDKGLLMRNMTEASIGDKKQRPKKSKRKHKKAEVEEKQETLEELEHQEGLLNVAFNKDDINSKKGPPEERSNASTKARDEKEVNETSMKNTAETLTEDKKQRPNKRGRKPKKAKGDEKPNSN